MATYIIVASGTDPLGPNEVEAGVRLNVSDGDTVIVDSSADENTRIVLSGGGSGNITVQVNDSNSNDFRIDLRGNLSSDITIADDVEAPDFDIRASNADAVNLTVGDNVEIGAYIGSDDGDTLTIGDNFTANGNITMGDGNDAITIGDGANVQTINTGRGDDTLDLGDDFTGVDLVTGRGEDALTVGDNANVDDISGGRGDDTITLGDDFTGDQIRGGRDDDEFFVGSDASINNISGGNGDDTLTTQTSLPGASGFETIVCFVKGTQILTEDGCVPIEALQKGDRVETMDRGLQVIRWIGSSIVKGQGALAPVRIEKGALGNERELWVSQQHRMMIDGWKAELLFGDSEVLVPAKHLADGKQIKVIDTEDVEYFHMLFDQHEIVFAEGVPSESFHPGFMGLGAMSQAAKDEILMIFPELEVDLARYGPSTRQSLRAFEGQLLTDDKELV